MKVGAFGGVCSRGSLTGPLQRELPVPRVGRNPSPNILYSSLTSYIYGDVARRACAPLAASAAITAPAAADAAASIDTGRHFHPGRCRGADARSGGTGAHPAAAHEEELATG